MIEWFDPAPAASELPSVLASPFDPAPPHPLARRAADALIAWIRSQPRLDAGLQTAAGGKMFGVLVVRDPDGRVGWLRGFSGMLDGAWLVPGFVPPLYAAAARDAIWPAGQQSLRELELALRALDASPEHAALRTRRNDVVARHARELAELQARHRDHRAARHAARAVGELDAAARHALDQASRADTAERRALDARHAGELAEVSAPVEALATRRADLERRRAYESRALMKQVHDSYRICNARGEQRGLRELFAPGEPPGGAGDCAAPKLLGHAYRLGLRPLALAEVWWGAPPLTGGRHAGQFYPACRGKCGPILPFMLDGLPHAAPPIFGDAAAIAADQPRVIFEDAWLAVVDKPCGLLSVPGRSGLLTDSVLTRLRTRYAGAVAGSAGSAGAGNASTGNAIEITVVHRLDLDTSGLLIVAKDPATHAALQRAFAERTIDKRYIAWLDGDLRRGGSGGAGGAHADHGTIELAIRVDLDDRPRQIVDPIHGKPALTEWRVLARSAGRTRVALTPRTGRTHQLRVHAAHPLGLATPIVGDRLYGRPGTEATERLQLHAEALAFIHPHTQRRLELVSPAPF
jgi:tRNA pseudouridine32 synthase/23S rRNA pseudouridine746 synthase